MAKIETVTLTDDIDGSTHDVVTCAFGLGDAHFEIDLSEDHRVELENFLAPFIEHARPIAGGKPSRTRRGKTTPRGADKDHTASIRAWARKNGHEVSDRGRISRAVVEAYDAVH